MLQQYLEVGQVTNAHGLVGEVRVHPWADSPEFLCQFKTVDAINETGIIIHLVRQSHLAAGGQLFHHRHLEACPGGI